MSESNAWSTLKKIFSTKDRVNRVENVAGTGTPDVNYCVQGTEGWIELKAPKEPQRLTTPLFGSNHPLTQDQKNWWLKHNRARGRGYILIATNLRWMAVPGRHADVVNDMTVDDLKILADWHQLKPVRKEKWKQLYNILGSKQNRTHTN